MTEPAALMGQLVDVRNVAVHKSVRLTVEVPAELAEHVIQCFGWPTQVNPVPVAIARLSKGDEHEDAPQDGSVIIDQLRRPDGPPHSHSETVNKPGNAGGAKRRWDDLSYAQQAGIRCEEPAFMRFLADTYDTWPGEDAATVVRRLCLVSSRKDIIRGTKAGDLWGGMDSLFRSWMTEPEVVG